MNYLRSKPIFTTALLIVTCIAVIAILVFNILRSVPVDVLQGWVLRTDKQSYGLNELVTITSTYNKVRDVTGTSTRKLVCGNQSYPINEAEGNKPPGRVSAKIKLIVPDDLYLPQTCFIRVEVNYRIFGVRDFPEVGETNRFEIR